MILSKTDTHTNTEHSTNPIPIPHNKPRKTGSDTKSRMSSFFGGGGAPAPANNQQLKMAKAEVKMYSDLFNK